MMDISAEGESSAFMRKEHPNPMQMYDGDDDPGPSSGSVACTRNDYESNHLQQRSHIAIIQMAPPAQTSAMNLTGTFSQSQAAASSEESEVKVVKTVSPSKRQKAGAVRVPRQNATSKPKKRHFCTVQGCTYNTSHTKDLARHMRKHTGEKPYNCDRCSKSFTRYDKLVMHIRIHEGHRPFSCQLCNYAATDSGSLKKHLRTHSDERPYKCHLCPYSSKDSSQLIVHLRHHTGDSPYVCGFAGCDAAFKTPSDLSRHTRLHTGEKPYKCSFCNYRAAVKSNLNVHMKRHTNPKPKNGRKGVARLVDFEDKDNSDEDEINPGSDDVEQGITIRGAVKLNQEVLPFQYACKFCDHKSDTIDLFNAHMKESHPDSGLTARLDRKPVIGRPPKKIKDFAEDQRKFQCPSCNAAFKCENSLRCHMRQHGTIPNKPANVDPQIYTPRIRGIGNMVRPAHHYHADRDEPARYAPVPTYTNETNQVQIEENYSLHEMQRMPMIQSVITENPNPTVISSNTNALENGSGAHIIKHHYDPTTGQVYAVAYENVGLDHLALAQNHQMGSQ